MLYKKKIKKMLVEQTYYNKLIFICSQTGLSNQDQEDLGWTNLYIVTYKILNKHKAQGLCLFNI